MPRFSWLALACAVIGAGACSLLNAPADVIPGGGGATTTASHTSSGTSTTGTGGATGTGGGAGKPCAEASDCLAPTDACQTSVCSAAGFCEIEARPDGMVCDDGNFCTTGDACVSGACIGAPRACPSADACNPGSCDKATMACMTAPGNDGAPCDDGDPCDQPGTCANGTCTRGADACVLLATDCIDAICTTTGCMTKNKLDGTPCGSFCADATCMAGHCVVQQPKNEDQACDDGLFCTVGDACHGGHCVGTPNPCPTGQQCVQGTCDESSRQCVSTPIAEGAPCDDGNPCTAAEFCSGAVCQGGQPPTVYFKETFATGGPGWTLGPEWQIGTAVQSFSSAPGDTGDPGFAYMGLARLAGADIGGSVDVSFVHPLYYLTSPMVNGDVAGPLYLTFYRWLNSDYQPFMQDTVEVSGDGGTTWHVVWHNADPSPIDDDAWTFQAIDVTAYKGPATMVRWGFAIGSVFAYEYSGWNIDYVKLQNAPCPL